MKMCTKMQELLSTEVPSLLRVRQKLLEQKAYALAEFLIDFRWI